MGGIAVVFYFNSIKKNAVIDSAYMFCPFAWVGDKREPCSPCKHAPHSHSTCHPDDAFKGKDSKCATITSIKFQKMKTDNIEDSYVQWIKITPRCKSTKHIV